MTQASGKTPMSSREEVEKIHAAQRLAAAAPPRPLVEGRSLKPPARVDAVFHDVSFRPTDAGIASMADLARALWARDTEALMRGWRLRNRRHWNEVK